MDQLELSRADPGEAPRAFAGDEPVPAGERGTPDTGRRNGDEPPAPLRGELARCCVLVGDDVLRPTVLGDSSLRRGLLLVKRASRWWSKYGLTPLSCCGRGELDVGVVVTTVGRGDGDARCGGGVPPLTELPFGLPVRGCFAGGVRISAVNCPLEYGDTARALPP